MPFIADIGGHFIPVPVFYGDRVKAGGVVGADIPGGQVMVYDIEAEFQGVFAVGVILKVFLQVDVIDPRGGSEVVVLFIVFDREIVAAEDQGAVQEQFFAEQCVPAQRSGSISPIGAKSVLETDDVLPEISREIDGVLSVDLVVSLCVDVIELEGAVFDHGIVGKTGEQVEVAATGADHERSLVIPERAFRLYAGGYKTKAAL